MTTPRFPDVDVKLTGTDGNAFAVLGLVRKALRTGGASTKELDEFMSDAMAGDYDELLATCARWVSIR